MVDSVGATGVTTGVIGSSGLTITGIFTVV
jgi:hypothetical protein